MADTLSSNPYDPIFTAQKALPVKQDDRRALSADPDREGRAIRDDVLNLKAGWKWPHICDGGHRHTFLAVRNRRRQFYCLPLYATASRRTRDILRRGGPQLSRHGGKRGRARFSPDDLGLGPSGRTQIASGIRHVRECAFVKAALEL